MTMTISRYTCFGWTKMVDISTTYYKKPDIMVTSMDDAFAQDKVNSAFRSLYDQMTTYQPDTTANDFADFCWRGNIKNKYLGKVKAPAREVPLVGMTSTGATLNVGYITTSGDVVFYDIDTVKHSFLCYDIVWQKVDANIFQAADYGNQTFQIGGNGPTLECNCLFKPCVWDGLCSTILPQTQYCYNYTYYYDGNLFYSNDGRYPNNIIGWTCVGGTAQFITTDNYDVSKVSCTCCECTMYANESCVGPDGTRWTINNTICQWCVYETWEIVPTGTGGVCVADPDTGKLLARPALWSWNGTNNYGPMRVSSFCNGINACRGFNVGAKEDSGIGYICWAGCCHACDHLVVNFNTQVMDRNWKAGRIQEVGERKINWNPNNEYWDHCIGFCWDARYPLDNVFDTNKQYWKSPSRTFKDCFEGLDFDEGWGTIPYSREVYDEMFRCWKECGCINTYNMWLGGNYINYALCWCCHVVSNQRCRYAIDDYHNSWAIKTCLSTLYDGWWCSELHPTAYTSLYYRDDAYGIIHAAWVPPTWVRSQASLDCTWDIAYVPADCYTISGWSYPIQVVNDSGRYHWEPQMMYGLNWKPGDSGDPWSCCQPGFNSVSSNMMFSNIDSYPWCECFRNSIIENYNPWYGFHYYNYAQRSCLYIPEVWWNTWWSWQYAPYSYCRLTTHYCVHREMQGTGNGLDLTDISIRVRYKTGGTK